MSKKGNKGNDKKQKGGGKASSSGSLGKGLIEIDPEQIYFTHSRVRPFFTGCNKRIEETLQEIINGVTSVKDIPLITVIPNDGSYFSLNNRRLFLFKKLRELGLLPNNVITAYSKAPLEREKQRYLASRCSLTAKLMKEFDKNATKGNDNDDESCGQENEEKGEEQLITSAEELKEAKTIVGSDSSRAKDSIPSEIVDTVEKLHISNENVEN